MSTTRERRVTYRRRCGPETADFRAVGRVGVARLIDGDREATDADVVKRAAREERERIVNALRDHPRTLLGMTPKQTTPGRLRVPLTDRHSPTSPDGLRDSRNGQ